MTTLFLLRHGPTEAHAQGAPLGRLDLPVNGAGQALWPRVRAELLELGLGRVLTSDLRRAREHAQDLGLPCRALPGLGEQAFGAWEGIPWSQIQGAEAFFARPVTEAPPGGESYAHCAERARAVLRDLEDGTPTMILAHGGPLRALLAHLLGLSLERSLDLAWEPFGLTRLERLAPDRALLRFHNRVLPSTQVR